MDIFDIAIAKKLGGGSGGGGNSDFGIANVTFINSSEEYRYFVRHLILVDDELEQITYEEEMPVDYDYPVTIPLVLYKGKYNILTSDLSQIDGSVMPIMTGGIELVMIDGVPCLQVTGDATLTAAGGEK